MKRITITALALFVLAANGCRKEETAPSNAPSTDAKPETKPGLSLRETEDRAEIFRRALWRSPGEDDRIVAAERRHWINNADEVREWSWYLTLRPSAELRTWLEEGRSFRFQPIDGAQLRESWPDDVPSWFPSVEKATKMNPGQTSDRMMTLLRDPDGQTLHMYGSGKGFREGM